LTASALQLKGVGAYVSGIQQLKTASARITRVDGKWCVVIVQLWYIFDLSNKKKLYSTVNDMSFVHVNASE
jgi:hypothetical protein